MHAHGVPFVSLAVNPPNEDELFEAMSSAKVSKAEELPLLVRTGEVQAVLVSTLHRHMGLCLCADCACAGLAKWSADACFVAMESCLASAGMHYQQGQC